MLRTQAQPAAPSRFSFHYLSGQIYPSDGTGDTLATKTAGLVSRHHHHPHLSSIKDAFRDVSGGIRAVASRVCEEPESIKEPLDVIVQNVASPLQNALSSSILDQIPGWVERSEVLIRALDDVMKIHPFAAVAIGVFKAAVQLEMQRRDNDSRVGILRVLRMDMMAVLADLKDVPKGSAVDKDSRLHEILDKIANDIKDCTYVSDQYVRQKFLVKFLKSPSWSSKLNKFSSIFQERKDELHFRLMVYTANGVQRVLEKVDLLLQFQVFSGSTAEGIAQLIQAKGGLSDGKCDDATIKEIVAKYPSALSTSTTHATRSDFSDTQYESRQLQELQKDLSQDIDQMLRKERDVFDRKFQTQMNQLQAHVSRESDRVISALSAGAWGAVKHKFVQKMWKDMGWKTNARTGRFVLALRDYLIEGYALLCRDAAGFHDKVDRDWIEAVRTFLKEDDKWTLSYIEITRMPPILEAFDDDASGFITVQELNTFISGCPPNWSLPQWVAFWAVGWHFSLDKYAKSINDAIIPGMLRIAQDVLPSNRGKVDRYLSSIYFYKTNAIAVAVNPYQDTNEFLDRFQPYIDAEEERLKKNLEDLKYQIDALNTLPLVTGPGRLERFLLPLMYLVLSQHYRLIELCTRETVSDDEFLAAANTLACIYHGAMERMRILQAVFEQQHVDPDKQFERCSHGLFKYIASPGKYENMGKKYEYPTAAESDVPPVMGRLEPHDLSRPLDLMEHSPNSSTDSLSAPPESRPRSSSMASLASIRSFADRYAEFNAQSVIAQRWSSHTYSESSTEMYSIGMPALRLGMAHSQNAEYTMFMSKVFVNERVRHYRKACRECEHPIIDVRFMCAVCMGPLTSDTVDFCAEHFDSTVDCTTDGVRVQHDPSHPILKARRIIHFRDELRLRNLANGYYKEIVASLSYPSTPTAWFPSSDGASVTSRSGSMPNCIGCDKPVEQPCYMCMDPKCNEEGQTFICGDCDEKEQIPANSTHAVEHLLLRISAPAPAPAPTLAQPVHDSNSLTLALVGTHLSDLERRYNEHVSSMEDRFSALEKKVDQSDLRLSRLEALLEKIANHLHVA